MSMEYRTLARLFHADRSMDSYANHDRLVRQRLEADSTFTTGIGTPLGELFIATPRCVCMLTQKVLLAERRVSAMWRSIPGVMRWNYIYHAISEELLATNEMEGVRSTRKETEAAVAAARQARTEGDMEKARFGEFAKLYLNLTNRDVELPKTLEDIRDIYDKIALDEIDDKNRPDGELFRKGDVEVQGPHGTVIHSGVSSGQAGICSRSTSATISLCPPCCPSPGRSRRTRTNTTRRSLRPRTNSTAGNSRSSYTPSSDSSNGRRNP